MNSDWRGSVGGVRTSWEKPSPSILKTEMQQIEVAEKENWKRKCLE